MGGRGALILTDCCNQLVCRRRNPACARLVEFVVRRAGTWEQHQSEHHNNGERVGHSRISGSGHGNGLAVWDRAGFEQHDAREITSAMRGRSRATPLPNAANPAHPSRLARHGMVSPHAVVKTYASAVRHLVGRATRFFFSIGATRAIHATTGSLQGWHLFLPRVQNVACYS